MLVIDEISPIQVVRTAYLDIVMNSVLGLIHEDGALDPTRGVPRPFDRATREVGMDWPVSAHSMIGLKRMRNTRDLAEQVVIEGVPGDLMETGVWRGGACIMFRAVLKAYGDIVRRVWVADSFSGLPEPSPQYPEDAGDTHHSYQDLVVSLEQVRENFEKYGLLDEQVVFLKGWFRDTLPNAKVNQIAVLRLDGDMYESTIIALESLFDKVSPGGFIIVDDYNYAASCRQAVDYFRTRHGITDPLQTIDQFGVFWRKSKVTVADGVCASQVDGDLWARQKRPEEGNWGYCHCCRCSVFFEIRGPWLRDQYVCSNCGSIPRQRALLNVLNTRIPDWVDRHLHEFEPGPDFIRRWAQAYSHSMLWIPVSSLSVLESGFEDPEALSFQDESFDILIAQDILSLVFSPEQALKEALRVLRPGGAFVFTLARKLELIQSVQRVRLLPGGHLEHLLDAVRFGSPENEKLLVKWDFGSDFELLAAGWCGATVSSYLVRDRSLGLDGEYLEVFALRKNR